ncbi:MAG: hypothetical protein JO062_02700 [Bryobacterales bacterium]|nr:hypothetical protein [Bryobacterales bacterium]
MKFPLFAAGVLSLVAGALHAQTKDTSGNGLLNGAFRFRQIAVVNFDQNNNPTEIAAAYGTITFNGGGSYTATGSYVDNMVSSGSPQALNVTGTYAIGSNGTGSITNPLSTSDVIYGAVAQGVFTGSATESAFNDLFIAIPSGTSTNASFNAPYWVGDLDFTGGGSTAIKNSLLQLTPNGSGGFGTITFNGQASNQTGTLTQTTTGATYAFQSDGSASLNFPLPSGVSTANALVSGARTMYVSADGNFVLGYTPSGYDIFFGVKSPASAPSANPCKCLFFWSGIEDDPTGAGLGIVGFEAGTGMGSWTGALSSYGDGNAVQHARANIAAFYNGTNDAPFDYGSDNQITLNSNGTSAVDFNNYQYAFSSNGQAFVGIGTQGVFTLAAGAASPPNPGNSSTGVYLNPVQIYNAASYQPVTSSFAPGETVSIFGTNLAKVTMSGPGGQPAPTNLGGSQVTVNGIAAPLYYVSPTQINFVMPFEINNATLATVGVINNGTNSNTVTVYVAPTNPGVFSSYDGLGTAAALHANFTPITASNSAHVGETISVFLTGLGTVTPTISDGALGSSDPNNLNKADVWNAGNLFAYFLDYTNGASQQATITYAGLAPGLLGYQMNVTVPSGVGPATNPGVYLDIFTNDADINQVQIPVGSGTSSASIRPQSRSRVPAQHPRSALRGSTPRLGTAAHGRIHLAPSEN